MRIGITARTVAFVTFFMASIGAAIVAVSMASARVSLHEAANDRASELGRTALALAGDDILASDTDSLDATLDSFAEQTGIEYLYVVDVDGTLMGGRPPVGFADGDLLIDPLTARARAATGEFRDVRGGVVHVAVPVDIDGRTAAVLRLAFSLKHIDARLSATRWRVVFFCVIGLMILVPLVGLGGLFVTRPLRKLTEAAQKIARQDFSIDLRVKTGDELEDLADALNELSKHMRSSMKRIRQLAFVDTLTQLPNKTGFMEQARRILADSEMPAAALLIDLDRFKRLNDIYGPREGDKLLHAAAHRIAAAARRIGDQFRHPEARPPLLARFSGDEYALLICGPSPTTAARAAAQAILESLREPFPLNEGEAVLTASIGVARAPVDGREIEELIRLANLALDGVKADGGDGCRFFEMEMTRRAVQRMTLENELRRAISNREFVVHYQPKVDSRSGEITGCEALVRWRRGDKIVGPAGFIPAAEDCGLIAEVGDFVLQESCAAAARWRAKGATCTVAVNVSAIQFQAPDFSRRVIDVLEMTGLPPHLLELELTESVAMRDPDEVIKQVQPMREKGVRFAIDDFGTGHSSLATLTRLPFDTFKIDQTFVRQMETDPSARVVVETILAMARALGYDTVGEGVETPTQFAFLRLNGCTTAQGWYFGKPAPESEFVARLLADRAPPALDAAV
jgi:diguanylate cyclase (GGDEF)-like protein